MKALGYSGGMRKRDVRPDDNEVATKGYLRIEFKTQLKRELRTEFRKEFATKQELRDGLNNLEFRLTNRMDAGFISIIDEMRKFIDTFQKLADQVIGEHKKFEVESVSIKHNYGHLEDRVKKVEEVVFPAQGR